MKVYEVLTESTDQQVGEAPMGMLKRAALGLGKKVGMSSASTALDVGDEANRVKKEFISWARASRTPLTVDALEEFLRFKGLEGGTAALEKLRADREARSQSRQAMARKAGQVVGAAGSAAKAGWNAAKNTYAQRRASQPPVNAGMYEAADPNVLTSAEIDQVIMSVVQGAYRKNPGVGRSKFVPEPPAAPAAKSKPAAAASAAPAGAQKRTRTPKPAPQFKSRRAAAAPPAPPLSPDIQNAINKLKAAGYNVSR